MSFNFTFNGRFDFTHPMVQRMCNISPTKLAQLLTEAGVSFNKDWVQEYQQKGITPMKPRFCEDTWRSMTSEQMAILTERMPEAEEYTRTSMGKPVNQWKDGKGNYATTTTTDNNKMFTSGDANTTTTRNKYEKEAHFIIEDMQSFDDKTRATQQQADNIKSAETESSNVDKQADAAKQERKTAIAQTVATAKTNPLYQAVRDVCVATIAEEGMDYLNEDEIEKRIDARINALTQSLDVTAINKLIDNKLRDQMKATMVVVKNEATLKVQDMGIQHAMFPKLLAMVQMRKPNGTRANVMLVGPAGSGKTTAAENVAKALELSYSYVGATYDKVDLFGYNNGHGHYQVTEFYKRYKDGGVMLLDEMDGFDPAVGVAANAAIDGTRASFPCGMIDKHTDNVNIAACNTFGLGANAKYVGRNRLDAATLNRFIKLDWGYDAALENVMIGNDAWATLTRAIRTKVDSLGVEIVISPRNGQHAVMMERTGMFTREEIITIAYRDGMEDDTWNQVKRVANL